MNQGLAIGKDMETGDPFSIACEKSQRILICGKTGTGKSYTLGVLIEELADIGEDIVLLADPQGIYWAMAQANTSYRETERLWDYDREPRGSRSTLWCQVILLNGMGAKTFSLRWNGAVSISRDFA